MVSRVPAGPRSISRLVELAVMSLVARLVGLTGFSGAETSGALSARRKVAMCSGAAPARMVVSCWWVSLWKAPSVVSVAKEDRTSDAGM